ncbi:MAG: hypothetical protein JW850_14140 [Thermoflexales bacterium]|nr:hypothetical protein [Thermoflexales bacterium]
MVVQGRLANGQTLTAKLQPGALSLALDQQTALVYDRAGRLWSAFLEGTSYRRGYDGRVLAKRRLGGQRQRTWLSDQQAEDVIARAAALMRPLDGCAWEALADTQAELEAIIGRAARFSPSASAGDAARFKAIYTPLGILPPDQYLALVLQATEGCPFNTCTFCTFYRQIPFRIKSPAEFRTHVDSVLTYLGPARPLRKGIFLAAANALAAPQRRLIELLDVMYTRLEADPSQLGWSAFLDGFSGARKGHQAYAELVERGLRRVYIGLESGHDPLLRCLNKPGLAADAVAAAQAVKAGGGQVCLIVLLGAGGERYAAGHVRDTVEAINAAGLGAGDMVYFSELVEQPGQPYGAIAAREQITALTPGQIRAQRRDIQTGLRFAGSPPKISSYDIAEFVY